MKNHKANNTSSDKNKENNSQKESRKHHNDRTLTTGLKEILSEGIATDKLIGWASEYSHGHSESRKRSMFQGHSLPAVEGQKSKLRNGEKLEKALELSPSMVLILDRWGNIEYANPRFLEVTGFSKFEITGKDAISLTSGMSLTPALMDLKNAVQKGRKWKGELEQIKKDGEPYYFSGKLTPNENEYGFITGFILTGEDVTEFRQTEQKLKQALEEKNVILAELHHRVKNNLAIVSGLMQLQAFNEEDDYVQHKLFSSAGRVKSLASMHEVLYESNSLIKITIAPILKKIIRMVREHYKSSNLDIEIHPEIEEVELNINQAHPCSLILNEIITNAYKHAFAKNQKGKIRINVYEEANWIFISVSDNGKGFAKDYQCLASQKKTTGYELLNSLVGQLGGEYKYESDGNNTTFSLRFEREDANGASNANLVGDKW